MVAYVECEKRLGFFEGYYYPALGKMSLVCSQCFDKLQQRIDKWMECVFSNSFDNYAFIAYGRGINPKIRYKYLFVDFNLLKYLFLGRKKEI